MTTALQFIQPEQLSRITDLELLARTVVEGFMSGLHRSPNSGASIEFAQYRPYTQGDDLRFVDWKLYARTDRLHCKQFHEETNLRCTILLDGSASMDYASGGITKFEYGRILAACLATLLNVQKDAVGLIAFNEAHDPYLPPRSDANHLRRILIELQNFKPQRATNAESALRFLGDVLKPRGMVILISDLLHPLDGVLEQLRSMRARRHDVMIFQISDPAEQTFPFEWSTTFIDAESSAEQFAIPDVVRREYLENRRRHFQAVRRESMAEEIDFREIATNEPIEIALHHMIHHRRRMLMTGNLKHRARGRKG
jgi:uncharacterized protein (DUF58 family)